MADARDDDLGQVQAAEKAGHEDTTVYPSGLKLAMIMTSVMASLFLVALDRTIIATAVPRITDNFHSLDDVSWYAGAYLITSCATQLFWGRIFTFCNTKTVSLAAIVVFEIGSALCGAAPSSVAFIIGRAIAGIGSAGIYSGTTVIVTHIVPLHKRPIFIAMMGMVFGISCVIGPLLGGAFTDHVSWRWCFYINLPIGGVALAVMFFFLSIKSQHDGEHASLKRQFVRLDPIGTVIFLPAMVCILLALQWGGITYPWGSGRIIALFVIGGVAVLAFVAVQIWRKEDATIPPRILTQRSVAAGAVYSMCVGGAMITMLYTLAIWFQAIKGVSAVRSGIDTVPMVLALTVAAIMAGGNVRRTGRYVPPMYLCAVLMAVGAGLITTFRTNTGHAKWIGYQVMFGFGIGVGMQQPSMGAQAVLSRKDVSTGVSIMFFMQSFGGAVFISIAQAFTTNYLTKHLRLIAGVDVGSIVNTGATQLRQIVPADKLGEVLVVYNESLVKSFIVATAAASFLIVPALLMEWKTLKPPGAEAKDPEAAPGSGGSRDGADSAVPDKEEA